MAIRIRTQNLLNSFSSDNKKNKTRLPEPHLDRADVLSEIDRQSQLTNRPLFVKSRTGSHIGRQQIRIKSWRTVHSECGASLIGPDVTSDFCINRKDVWELDCLFMGRCARLSIQIKKAECKLALRPKSKCDGLIPPSCGSSA